MSKEVLIKGIGRTSYPPTSASDGAEVLPMYDKNGRQVVMLYTVRDMMKTAAASVSTGTSTTLLAGDEAVFHDLLYIRCANNSDAATTIVLKDDGTTVRTFDVPANDYVAETLVPHPQNAKGGNWDVDMPDITGTTVEVTATFIKNN
jgi:hypothetical protein